MGFVYLSSAPFWFNALVFMQMYEWYLLATIIPAFYIVIVKIFGFPLLQRWGNETILFLFPNKAKFAKVTMQYEPYTQFKKGWYWLANPLMPIEYIPIKTMKKKGVEEKTDGKPILPTNMMHIFMHSINQEVFSMDRRDPKVSELISGEHKIKSAAKHGIWLMRYPLLHFHRHWLITIGPDDDIYELKPVKEKQQYDVSFYHSLGVIYQRRVEKQEEVVTEHGGQNVVSIAVTNQMLMKALKSIQEYPNFSASRAYRLASKMNRIEKNWYYWMSGSFNPVLIAVLGGMAAAIFLVFYAFHGSAPPPGVGGH